jgi:hypothetical protein
MKTCKREKVKTAQGRSRVFVRTFSPMHLRTERRLAIAPWWRLWVC